MCADRGAGVDAAARARAGVVVGLIDDGGGRAAAALRSRYARWREVLSAEADGERTGTAGVGAVARPALLATSDETLLWMSRQRAELAPGFRLLLASAAILEALLDKRHLHELAQRHGLAVPRSIELGGSGDVAAAARALAFRVY